MRKEPVQRKNRERIRENLSGTGSADARTNFVYLSVFFLILGTAATVLLFFIPSTSAGVVEAENVPVVVETWVRELTADARSDAFVKSLEPYREGGEITGYVAVLENGGFCIASADDMLLPVYLYSPEGEYHPEDPAVRHIFWEMKERRQNMRRILSEGEEEEVSWMAKELESRQGYWEALKAGEIPDGWGRFGESKAEPNVMELDLSCKWHQGSPYNDQCVELTPGADEHVVVGCNATATLQIMYYWQWPNAGTGSGSVTYDWRYRTNWDYEALASDPGIPADWGAVPGYEYGRLTWTSGGGGYLRMTGYWDASVLNAAKNDNNITNKTPEYLAALQALYDRLTPGSTNCYANFGAAAYDWSIINDTHSDPPDAGDVEVAKLNNHVAIGVNSTFGVWGTSSYFGNDVAGLEDHFGYDYDALFTQVADIYSITTDILWLRPTGLGGSSEGGGGHAWVVHGYNKSTDPHRQFLMNFGWGGSSDGWYTFDNAPFPLNHDMMTRIAPPTVKFVDNSGAGDGSPNNPYGSAAEAVAEAPNHSTLIFKAGSAFPYSGDSLTFNKPLLLRGYQAVIGN